MRPIRRVFSLFTVFALAACGDLAPPDPDASTPPDGTPPDVSTTEPPIGGPHVTHAIEGDAFRATVNASDTMSTVYLDLDTGAEVTPVDPANDATWDLAFRRSKIEVNGGVSGTGGVEVARLDATAFAAVTTAPTSGYVTDAPDGDDADADPDLVFGTWYDYDPVAHVLSPADRTYVVKTTEGAYVKVRLVAYYDGVGTSGYPAFLWRAIPQE